MLARRRLLSRRVSENAREREKQAVEISISLCISMIVRGVGREGDAMDARVLTLVLKSP